MAVLLRKLTHFNRLFLSADERTFLTFEENILPERFLVYTNQNNNHIDDLDRRQNYLF